MAVSFIMEVHDMGLRMHISLVLNERLDCLHMRECLHTKLAVEPAAQTIENLVLLLCTVPYW